MTYWHLLWMFVTALGIIALGMLVPLLWAYAHAVPDYAYGRQLARLGQQRRRLETERYGQPLRGCLYCGSVCEFGPNCANHDLEETRKRIAKGAKLTSHRFEVGS
ncbi:MAG TPA: hypothetical protein VJN18_32220 [Polyangiaceae bacterium]|nr:hypothetical protein [Polyangiaceae bacterium]